MIYTKGDTPAGPLLVVPTRDDRPVDLEPFDTADALLVFPDGTTAAAPAVIDRDDPEEVAVAVTLPTLAQAGLVEVHLQLSNAETGVQETFGVPPFPVQELDGWHTLTSARGEEDWPKHLEDPHLWKLLEVAKRECITYKPEAGTRRPDVAERMAQLLQAKNRNAAARVDPATGDAGAEGYTLTPFPMDWTVKGLLRPRRRIGSIL